MKRDNAGAPRCGGGARIPSFAFAKYPVVNGPDEMAVGSYDIRGWLIGRELFNETKWLPTERTMEGESAWISPMK